MSGHSCKDGTCSPRLPDLPCVAKRWLLGLCIGIGFALAPPGLAAPIAVDHAVYRGAATLEPPAPAVRAKRVGIPELIIQLPQPSAAELAALKRKGSPRQHPIGMGRPLPHGFARHVDHTELSWSHEADGSQRATFAVTSPGAEALRLLLHFDRFPDGVELRFSGYHSAAPISPPLTPEAVALRQSSRGHAYWSPVVSGDTIVVEIALAPRVSPDALAFSVPRVSHLTRSADSAGKARSLDTCSPDPACDVTGIPQAVIDSVALFHYSDDEGTTFACSGVLLNHPNAAERSFFLTANHCISSPALAATMNFYWFHQRLTCTDDSPVGTQVGLGGARLLSTSALPQAPDVTLVELIEPPPPGVGLSGWTSAQLPVGSAVTSIHHPGAGAKKVSYGTAEGWATAQADAKEAVFIRTSWAVGVTEPGSSGGGLWAEFDGALRLTGNLWGGDSACDFPAGEDYFSRFDLAFRQLQPWLAPATPSGDRVQLNGTVVWGDVPVCALVLANGQHGFSCDGAGTYNLSVPLDADGGITVFAFADGFTPHRERLTPRTANISRSLKMSVAATQRYPLVRIDQITRFAEGGGTGGSAIVRGTIWDGTAPVCALVLANGQHVFSCQGTGAFTLTVPLDESGEITLFAFADGFAPYRTRF